MVAVDVDTAAEMMGCKRRMVFRLLSEGVLRPATRWGKKTMILKDSVDAALIPAGRSQRAPRPRTQVWEPVSLGDIGPVP